MIALIGAGCACGSQPPDVMTTTGALTFVEMYKDGVDRVDGLLQANDVTVRPDGSHVYATGIFAVAVFSMDHQTR